MERGPCIHNPQRFVISLFTYGIKPDRFGGSAAVTICQIDSFAVHRVQFPIPREIKIHPHRPCRRMVQHAETQIISNRLQSLSTIRTTWTVAIDKCPKANVAKKNYCRETTVEDTCRDYCHVSMGISGPQRTCPVQNRDSPYGGECKPKNSSVRITGICAPTFNARLLPTWLHPVRVKQPLKRRRRNTSGNVVRDTIGDLIVPVEMARKNV